MKARWTLPHTPGGHLRWGSRRRLVRSTGGGPDDERLCHERLGLVADDPGHARLLGAGRRARPRPAAAPRPARPAAAAGPAATTQPGRGPGRAAGPRRE